MWYNCLQCSAACQFVATFSTKHGKIYEYKLNHFTISEILQHATYMKHVSTLRKINTPITKSWVLFHYNEVKWPNFKSLHHSFMNLITSNKWTTPMINPEKEEDSISLTNYIWSWTHGSFATRKIQIECTDKTRTMGIYRNQHMHNTSWHTHIFTKNWCCTDTANKLFLPPIHPSSGQH
jgi:hypothetical protein